MDMQKVCVQIVKCLENVWSENLLFNFAVKVQGETIKCHRLILAACSDFFKALFRSGMKEVTEHCVVLKDVSCDVFLLIMNSIYTGTSLLTLDNFIEVWRAAQMLQVNFLVNVCEEFAIKACSLDTWENIYDNAKLLCSKRVLDQLRKFLLKHFEQISLSTTFLNMTFKKVQELITSQDLVVSKEDFVLDSVIKWVEYVPEKQLYEYSIEENHDSTIRNTILINESVVDNTYKKREDYVNHDTEKALDNIQTRSEINESFPARSINSINITNSSRKYKLTELLMQVRTCLVSSSVLSRLLKTKLFSDIEDAKEIIVDAMSYHANSFRHGQWPSAAMHRSCSKFTHAGVYAFIGGYFEVLTAGKEELFSVTKCEYLQENIQLVTFDGELFATRKQQNQPNGPCRMFVFCGNSWKEVMEMPSHNLLLVSHGDFIYIINKDDKVILHMNPKMRIPVLENLTHLPKNVDVKQVVAVQDFLLLFCSETHNSIPETAVYQMDFSSKVWSRLDNIDGPAEHLISFKNDKYNYILQSNGRMWMVVHSPYDKKIKIVFFAKLWNFDTRLYGGLTFQGKLIVFGQHPRNDSPGMIRMKKLSGHFRIISHWGNDDCLSFVPITISNIALLPLDEC